MYHTDLRYNQVIQLIDKLVTKAIGCEILCNLIDRPHLGWNFYRLSTEIDNELRPVSAPASVLVNTSPEIILAPNPIGTSSGAVNILGIEHRATVTLIDNLDDLYSGS